MPSIWSPDTDTHITQRYNQKTLEQKVRNKTALQKELGWPVEGKCPLVALPLGMTEVLGGEVLKVLLPGLLTQSLQLVILGKGSKEYGTLLTELLEKQSHRIAILQPKEESIHRMISAADMALFFNAAGSSSEIQACLAYGVVPIAPESAELENYDPVQERGNAFLFGSSRDPAAMGWSAFAAVVRALETFKFPFDWRTIQRHCMESAA